MEFGQRRATIPYLNRLLPREAMKRHGKHAPNKQILSIVLDSSLKQELRERANANRRVLSDYVRIILEDAVGTPRQSDAMLRDAQ